MRLDSSFRPSLTFFLRFSVSGRVRSRGLDAGPEGVKLKLGDLEAVSEPTGIFSFRAVPPGNYILKV